MSTRRRFSHSASPRPKHHWRDTGPTNTRLSRGTGALVVAAACAVAGLGTTAHSAPAAAADSRPEAMLIVAVHTDDEMSLSHLWIGRPGVHKVFLWLDATDASPSKKLNPRTGKPVRWNPGEYNPLDYPGGLDTGYFRGSMLNIGALRRSVDRSLPYLNHDKPSHRFTRGDREVTTWLDPNRGAAVKYNSVGVRSFTPQYVEAINDVTLNPTKYGLPNYRWTDLIAASYHNYSGTGGDRCDTYAPRLHRNSHEAAFTRSYPQFSGNKYHAICKDDEFPNKRSGRVNARTHVAAYSPRGGSVAVYFGWLYSKQPPITTTKSGVFSTEQWYTWLPAAETR